MKTFCQIIGIPTGFEPTPFFTNLFSYYCESKWINPLKKNNLKRARKLCNLFRFTDDLNVINDEKEFENNFQDIYPEELLLNNKNSDNIGASFLDFQIKIKNGKFIVGLFGKSATFPLASLEFHANSSFIYHLICSAFHQEQRLNGLRSK